MGKESFKIVLAQDALGTWRAQIPAVPQLAATGDTGNEALARVWENFGHWQKGGTLSSDELARVWQVVYASVRELYVPQPATAVGDFKVDSDCCISCGVPQAVAPDLVGWTEAPLVSCYWKKQPETPYEFERAFAVFDSQEAGCHRYAGTDPLIQLRVGLENCDAVAGRPPINAMLSTQWGTARTSSSSHAQHGLLQRLRSWLRWRR